MKTGREELDFAVLTLEQHFGDRRGAAEIAVNLERRMLVEEIGIYAARVVGPSLPAIPGPGPARRSGWGQAGRGSPRVSC